ncbi:MAG: methyltransferase domain-containing protein [Planctomycetota bacterium]
MTERGIIETAAAEFYEAHFVPALFAAWAPRVLEHARLGAGQSVLDVACGTGVLSRAARELIRDGRIVGLDASEGMIAVASRRTPEIEWCHGRAEELPFEDGTFDRVISQFGIMFFEDIPRALDEMIRVTKPGGRVVVAFWDSLARSPGFRSLVDFLRREAGEEAAQSLEAPFRLGDPAPIATQLAKVGPCTIDTPKGTARFPSIRAWIEAETKGWTLGALAEDPERFEGLIRAAERDLAALAHEDGSVAFEVPAHIVSVAVER